MMFYRTNIESPIGEITLVARDGVLLLLEFTDAEGRIERALQKRFGDVQFVNTENPFGLSSKINAYFSGDLTSIDNIQTDGGGTEFQQRVWAELRRIPHGLTISYGQLATRLGDKNAMRAVGLANGRNPISIVVPCHRVIGANGAMTGYGGGVARKEWLLRHEGAILL